LAGIYIHIPFCKQACHYCNFHFSTSLRYKAPLVDALTKEIELATGLPPFSKGATLDTIYLGGGTPSILSVNELQKIWSAIEQNFLISSNAEITLEANPDDITPQSLQNWRSLGINRLSVGIQSFQPEELKWMNRAHNHEEAFQCLQWISEAGFDNYSIDLIYGSPLLTDAQWQSNVEHVLKYRVPHISCYALTIEPQTPLDKLVRKKERAATDNNQQADQFLLLMDWMHAAGYLHYEISNFSLPGKQSKHNSSYWQQQPYLGIGPSAHSYDGKSRRWNVANNAKYIQAIGEGVIPFESETLTPIQRYNEYVMTALRTMEGISLKQIEADFGFNQAAELKRQVIKWVETQKIIQQEDFLQLTREGKLYADGIAADLFI
jgi:oxygen-independent coproporphyrinogen-3 oxidase